MRIYSCQTDITAHCTPDPRILRVWETWIFGDYMVRCCEITPSHELWPTGTEIEFADGVSETDREELQEAYSADPEVAYVHKRPAGAKFLRQIRLADYGDSGAAMQAMTEDR